MTPLRVLIIDDDMDLRQALSATLEEEDNWEIQDRGFGNTAEVLERIRPDMVVLDLIEGQGADGRATGNDSFGDIRRRWFCPVVVYSAFPERQGFNHPLVATVTKGVDTELDVRGRLRGFVPHAVMIRSVHEDFDTRVREALHDSVQALREQPGATGGTPQEVVLPRAVRRLVAARVDAGASSEARLLAWERFVVPPLGSHLLTGDILCRDIEHADEDDFRLVLSPSCDLVVRRNGRAAVDRVLVARCEEITRLGKYQLTAGRHLSDDMKENLLPLLTEGMVGHFLPIPEFRGQVPPMVANVKRLELLGWREVQLEGEEDGGQLPADQRFRRVASTDSPFREMVVWAYLRVAGRPGLPDVDVNGWLDMLSNHLAARNPT